MEVCYFNKDYERIYNCKYEKKNGGIEVTIEYAITNKIAIKLDGYIEIEMSRKVKYNEMDKYIYELMIYIQLLKPDKLRINKITVCIDETYYVFFHY